MNSCAHLTENKYINLLTLSSNETIITTLRTFLSKKDFAQINSIL